MSLRARPGVFAFAVLCCLYVALFRRALFDRETFVFQDLRSFHRPMLHVVRSLACETGGVPGWIPLLESGKPCAANPVSAALHPWTLLTLPLPFEWAFRLQVIAPLAASAFGMWLLLRALRRTRAAALFGSACWGVGGYLLSTTHLWPTLFTVAPLPASLAFAILCARRGARRDVACLALSFGLQIFGAEPAVLLSTVVLLPIAVVSGSPGTRIARRGLALVLLGLGLGVGLAAAVWVPGLTLYLRSVRAGGLPAAVAGVWSLAPRRLLELLFPRGEDPTAHGYPYILSLSSGSAAIVLALVAGLRRRIPRLAVWWLPVLLGAALAMGMETPIFPWLRRWVPGLSAVRYPEKFILLVSLPVVVLASAGLDLLRRRSSRVKSDALSAWVGVSIAAAVGAASTGREGFLWSSGGAIAAGLLVVLVSRFGPGARALALTLLSAYELSTGSAVEILLRTRPIDEVSRPPELLVPALKANLQGPLFHYAEGIVRFIPSLADDLVLPPMPAEWGLASTLEIDYDLSELRWSAEATQAFWELIQEDGRLMSPLLSRRGVAVVVLPRPAPDSRTRLQLAFTRERLPFAFLARNVERANGFEEWKSVMRRLGPRAASAVCLERSAAAALSNTPAGGDVEGIVRRPEHLEIRVDVRDNQPGLLAVNQTWDVYWSARVDGASAPLLLADLALTAVVVPPGRHVVELDYRDPSRTAGATLSLVSLLALFLVALRLGRVRRVLP